MSTDHVLDGRYELHDVLGQGGMAEAQALAGLNHPGIVSVHDVGHEHGSRSDEPSVPFIVMEYVIGQSLRARLHEGALTLEESIRLQAGGRSTPGATCTPRAACSTSC